MSIQPANLPGVVNPNQTDNFFTNLYINLPALSTNVNDVVLTFFEEFTGDRDSAAILASSVIVTALSQKVDPMALIEKFKEMPRGELSLYLAAFLNLNRVNTSLLGIKNQPRTGFFVQRSILA